MMKLLLDYLPTHRFPIPGRIQPPAGYVGFCVSYPKSGRTWLRVMLHAVQLRLRFTHAGSEGPHNFRGPWRFGGKVVFLHRDPLDTVVSNYFHVTKRRQFTPDWRDCSMSDFVRSRLGIVRIMDFNTTWLRALRTRSATIVTYEQMRADPGAVLRLLLHSFDQTVDDETIQLAVAAGSFDIMRQQETAGNKYNDVQLNLRDPSDPETYKVRRGIVGGYRDYLSAEDIEYCRKVIGRYPAFGDIGQRRVA
jgi:hypothetical protein